MISEETLELLNGYVDAELDEDTRRKVRAMIESNPEVRQAYADLRQLKRLVQSKAGGPLIPGGLAGRIFRGTRRLEPASRAAVVGPASRRAFKRRVLTSVAVTLVLALGIWLAFFAPNPPSGSTPIAHASVVHQIAKEFATIGEPPPPLADYDISNLGQCERSILQEIESRYSVALDRLPRFEGASFVSFCGARIGGVDCVRLDYRDETATNPHSPGAVISVFAVSLGELPRTVDEIGEILHCKCPKVRGPNIFCFRDRVADFKVATWKSRDEFDSRMRFGGARIKECQMHDPGDAGPVDATGPATDGTPPETKD